LNQSIIIQNNFLRLVNDSRSIVSLKPANVEMIQFNFIHEKETLIGLNNNQDFKLQFESSINKQQIVEYDEISDDSNEHFNSRTFIWFIYSFISLVFITCIIYVIKKFKKSFIKFFSFKKQAKTKTEMESIELAEIKPKSYQ